MQGVREVIEHKGLFCSLYSDRGSHFFYTPKAGEQVDRSRPTQLGRALKELGIQMIAAYSPQARGRSERNFGTWQGRLPQELRLAAVKTLEEANRFLHERYIAEFNQKFAIQPTQKGTAFRRSGRNDLDWIFSIQTERVVGQDNTVAIKDRWWQIGKCRWRHTLAGQTVTIHEHLDDSVSIRYGPHVVGRFAEGRGKAGAVENQTQVSHSHRPLENSQPQRVSHFSTAPTTALPSQTKRRKS
jgi:hypothetical protein